MLDLQTLHHYAVRSEVQGLPVIITLPYPDPALPDDFPHHEVITRHGNGKFATYSISPVSLKRWLSSRGIE